MIWILGTIIYFIIASISIAILQELSHDNASDAEVIGAIWPIFICAFLIALIAHYVIVPISVIPHKLTKKLIQKFKNKA